MAKSMTDLDSLGPRGGGGGSGGGDDEFDLEQDAINAYYAVRMGERRRSAALMRREEEEGELRATVHLMTILLEGQGNTELFRLDRVNIQNLEYEQTHSVISPCLTHSFRTQCKGQKKICHSSQS